MEFEVVVETLYREIMDKPMALLTDDDLEFLEYASGILYGSE